jgi:superfamily II helicase
MASAAQPLNNRTDETPVELQELIQAIDSLPPRQREEMQPALNRVVECSMRRRRILNLVQEALSQLRLDMKYLVFDLEATRRERDQLRQQIDEFEEGNEEQE